MASVPWWNLYENLLHNSTGAFSVGVKDTEKWFQHRNDLEQQYTREIGPLMASAAPVSLLLELSIWTDH